MYFKGPNPTVDVVVIAPEGKTHKILLIRRAMNSNAEPGKWALPGGFQETTAKKGERWLPGRESALTAAVRELREETGLTVCESRLLRIGVYEGGGRDPRDSADSWSKSTAWLAQIDRPTTVVGQDDADRAEWVDVQELDKRELAFDHRKIISDGWALWQRQQQAFTI